MESYKCLEMIKNTNGVVTILLSRPECSNALNGELIAELNHAFMNLKKQQNVRLLILRGKGKNFCAGADLKSMQASVHLSYEDNLSDAHQLSEMLHNLHTLNIPSLAVVHGAAYAGALGIITACDMALGTDTSQFCLSEVNIGLIPSVISPYVVKAIGNRYAQYLALTAKRINGITAEKIGLLTESCAEEMLDTQVNIFIEQFIKCAPIAQKQCKLLFREIGDCNLSEKIRDYTEQTIAKIRVSNEGQKGLNAFLNKKKQIWH